MNEQEFVVKQFQKAFEKWQGENFVLYGLGKNTEAVLKQAEGFHFAGLMDARNTGKKFWGLPVLSEKEVLELKPRIVIIARESVVPVIYARIAHLQKEHGLQIYNFKGEIQGKGKSGYANQGLPYWNATEEGLKEAICIHDCISFDIFDTLLMRKVLEPADVFGIVERILEGKGYIGNGFQECRVQAEASLEGYPSLKRIYEEMGRRHGISADKLAEWMELEIQVEGQVIVPRRKIIALFQYALTQGKKVFLITDMYFGSEELEMFLRKYGIKGYDGLLVSCENRKGKADGSLFEVYKQMADGENYLHIGDNRRSDVEKAQEHGLDTFQVYSAYEMWMASSMQGTLAHAESLEQRCILGNLVWKCCEDPFALHGSKGSLTVDDMGKLGYVFLGALYDEFMVWMLQKLGEAGVERLLLPARDGFLIGKMLDMEKKLPFEYIYFKASRRAVSVAAIRSEEDILFLAERGFQGSLGELLWQRYGVKPGRNDRKKDFEAKGQSIEDIKKYVLSYKEKIFRRAEKERMAYLEYLGSMGIQRGKKQVVFDFVASGTVQHFLQKLLGRIRFGIYFATMNVPDGKSRFGNEIISAYGDICPYGSESQVAKHYLFLETIMVDGCPTLRCIERGDFVYEPEACSSFSAVREVQEGILHYHRDMQEMRGMFPEWEDEREFADSLFGRLFDGSCQVERAVKQKFVNDDVFDGVKTYPVWSE